MKFYSHVLGDREYSLLEVMHFGLRLPGTLSNFGTVVSVSVSNWSTVKSKWTLSQLQDEEKADIAKVDECRAA